MRPVPGRAPGSAIVAGLAYFAIVFAAGFVLGAVRTLLLVPRIGAVPAVLVELPFMLAIAYAACRWLVSRLSVSPALGPRLTMGVVAFVLLMGAELTLSVLFFSGSVAGFIAGLVAPAGTLGLAGQVAFAAIPLAVGRR
jgi:hypothetical protein